MPEQTISLGDLQRAVELGLILSRGKRASIDSARDASPFNQVAYLKQAYTRKPHHKSFDLSELYRMTNNPDLVENMQTYRTAPTSYNAPPVPPTQEQQVLSDIERTLADTAKRHYKLSRNAALTQYLDGHEQQYFRAPPELPPAPPVNANPLSVLFSRFD